VDMLELIQQDKLSFFLVPVFSAAILTEIVFNWWQIVHRHGTAEEQGCYRLTDTLASFWLLSVATAVDILPRAAAITAMVLLHEISPLRDVVQRQWWAWCLLFVLDDFIYYWFHRISHSVRLLWAGHINHHSSRAMHLGTAVRAGVGERLHKMLFWIWLPLLGFDTGMVLVMMSFNLFYQFWLHTERVRQLPQWFEYVFNTPSHHRVHHACNVRYLDANHGGVLILWDRWFGTFIAETKADPCIYGLTTKQPPAHLWHIISHEYRSMLSDVRRARRCTDKLSYLFLAPGWSHDGVDKRSRTLKVSRKNQV